MQASSPTEDESTPKHLFKLLAGSDIHGRRKTKLFGKSAQLLILGWFPKSCRWFFLLGRPCWATCMPIWTRDFVSGWLGRFWVSRLLITLLQVGSCIRTRISDTQRKCVTGQIVQLGHPTQVLGVHLMPQQVGQFCFDQLEWWMLHLQLPSGLTSSASNYNEEACVNWEVCGNDGLVAHKFACYCEVSQQ